MHKMLALLDFHFKVLITDTNWNPPSMRVIFNNKLKMFVLAFEELQQTSKQNFQLLSHFFCYVYGRVIRRRQQIAVVKYII